MTNYEWLVKNGKLEEFIFDITVRDISNITWAKPVMKKYNFFINWGDKISEKIAEWLQAEHKTKDYVSREDVIDILNNPLKIAIEHKKNMVTLDEVSRAFAEDYKDKLERVCKLEVKEIDE